jgi:hypothetical protein
MRHFKGPKDLLREWMLYAKPNVEEVITVALDWYRFHKGTAGALWIEYTHLASLLLNQYYKVCRTLVLICQFQQIYIRNACSPFLCMKNTAWTISCGSNSWNWITQQHPWPPSSQGVAGSSLLPFFVLCTRIIKLSVNTHCANKRFFIWSNIKILGKSNVCKDAQNSLLPFCAL